MAESRHSVFRQFAASDWDGFLKGVEKEGCGDRNGFIAQTPHPEALGSRLPIRGLPLTIQRPCWS